MKFSQAFFVGLTALNQVAHAAPQDPKGEAQFTVGQPIDTNGKGGPILGGTNSQVDKENPGNLGQQPTDNGVVPNLKWRFSDSKTRILNGGWVREQVIQDLPQSHDIAAAQQHLRKGAVRELHWHKVAEWGFVYSGSVLVSAVDENGKYQAEKLTYGDIWYFPKGAPHTIQGLDDENEYLLAFDEADFDKIGTTFNIVDWLAHTPRDVLAKNFGVNASLFDKLPSTNPYIFNGTVAEPKVNGGSQGYLEGNSSFVYRTLQHPAEKVPGNGGEFRKIDSTNFPISKTIAATFAEEWLYFHKGKGRATVFIGSGAARTFDFAPGDTAAFPDNSGHYIENTSETEDLVWIELYKSDRVVDVPLTQWLALTPPEIVAQTLKVPVEFVEQLKKERQILV
ncbi:putative oxalate decarboxylase [Colletotrichum orbiculare MAFF 240422]|uniref:Oxalate decarboxylase n=1 Tax=Colletotrichum orbiculare (strain 104-T / ATCC 96160 / CBS 514.97 / LARS 414 / MAFF 240422) TaxID=1213857 RepID=N4VDZ8_COLOR|nr:putative oxalate decarboxylase [Colletotrichum orbiculare MAFF 240422]